MERDQIIAIATAMREAGVGYATVTLFDEKSFAALEGDHENRHVVCRDSGPFWIVARCVSVGAVTVTVQVNRPYTVEDAERAATGRAA